MQELKNKLNLNSDLRDSTTLPLICLSTWEYVSWNVANRTEDKYCSNCIQQQLKSNTKKRMVTTKRNQKMNDLFHAKSQVAPSTPIPLRKHIKSKPSSKIKEKHYSEDKPPQKQVNRNTECFGIGSCTH